MYKKKYLKMIFIKSTGIILSLFIFFSCEKEDKWTIKKREFDRTESFNYSEYVSGELDSTAKSQLEQSKQSLRKHQQSNTTHNEKKAPPSPPKKPTPPQPSMLDRILNTISDFIDSILNLF